MLSVHGTALLVALLLNATANIMMKVGMSKVQADGGLLRSGAAGAIATIVTSPVLLFGLLCFALNALCYMFALQSKALKISIAYPVMVGGGYAIIAAVGFLYLGDRLNAAQWTGVALILAGVMMVALQTNSAVTT